MPWRRKGRAWVRRSRHYVLRVSTGHLPTNHTQWWRVVLARRQTGEVLADLQHCDGRRYAQAVGRRLRRYFRERDCYERQHGSIIWTPESVPRPARL